jgi:hypothetical protein
VNAATQRDLEESRRGRFCERHGFVNQPPGETGRVLYSEREL